MAAVNFSTLLANKSNFTPGQDSKLFISTGYDRGDSVPSKTFTLSSVSAVGTGATATVTVVSGVITNIAISAGGSGYVNGAQIAFTGTGGSGASATLTVVGGIVTGFTNLVGGTGYPTSTTTAAITGFTSSGAVSVGDIEIGLTAATTVDLYEGTRLPFVDAGVVKPIYVAKFTAAGATALPILPAKQAVTTGAVATINAWVPFFSANQINLEDSATVIAEQVFSNSLDPEKAVVQLDGKSNTQGPQVYLDPGLAILRLARTAAQLVHVTIIKGFQRGGADFDVIVAGLPQSIQKNQFVMQTANLERSGAIFEFDY